MKDFAETLDIIQMSKITWSTKLPQYSKCSLTVEKIALYKMYSGI